MINNEDNMNKEDNLQKINEVESPQESHEERVEDNEISLQEGIKCAWRYVLNLKLLDVFMGLMCCVLVFLIGLFLYHFFLPILGILVNVILKPIEMSIGESGWSWSSHDFFDSDLFYTIPFSICVSIVVGKSFRRYNFLLGMLYLIFLLFSLEFWDYNFHEMYAASPYLGGLCWVITSVLLPILFYLRRPSHVKVTNEKEDINDDNPDNSESVSTEQKK